MLNAYMKMKSKAKFLLYTFMRLCFERLQDAI